MTREEAPIEKLAARYERNMHKPWNKPMTNADRIRAMSDEELAYWVMCPWDEPECQREHEQWDCMACTLRWLQQPVKEDA